MKDVKTIAGFIAGISIGVIAGILLSPEKGSDTRQRIADRTSDLGQSLKNSFTDFIKGKKNETNGETTPSMKLNTMG